MLDTTQDITTQDITTQGTAGAAGAPSIRTAYELTAADVARAARVHGVGQLLRRPTVVGGCLILAAVAALELFLTSGDVGGAAAAIGGAAGGGIAFALLGVLVVAPLRARRGHRRNRLLRVRNTLDADAAAVRFTSEIGMGSVPWPDVVRWREDRRVVLLYASDRLYYVVPKRALAPGEAEALRAFQLAGQRERPADGGAARGLAHLFAAPTAPAAREMPDGAPDGPQSEAVEAPLAVSRTWITSRADIVAAQRLALRRRWRRSRTLLMLVVPVAAVGLLSGFPARGAASLAGLPLAFDAKAALGAAGFLIGVRVLYYAAMPLLLRNFRRRQPDFAYPWRVELDRTGLRAVMPHRDIRVAWGDYVAFAEDTQVILAYQSDALFQFVPTHAVDADFLAVFRELTAGRPRR